MVDSVWENGADYTRLLEIMARLRAPDGCPWDREQTHASLRANLIEETYEALEAIDSGDDKALAEELGDVLLQVVFHAQLAAERGAFAMGDVVRGLCDKLVYRHEHVFGGAKAADAAEALAVWDARKQAAAKAAPSGADRLRAVPPALPALMRAEKLQGRARKFGWEDAEPPRQDGSDIGDALWSVVRAAREAGVNPELALRERCEAFIDQCAEREQAAQETR